MIFTKIVDVLVAAREIIGCKRCTGRSVAVTSFHFGGRVITSYVYTNDDSVVHPKYSIIRAEMVPFNEISELCNEMEEHMYEGSTMRNNFGTSATLLIVDDKVAVPLQELFNSLAGPTKDFRYNSDVSLKEALYFVDDSEFDPVTSDANVYMRLYTVDVSASSWKITDFVNTKLLDLLNPKECATVIQCEMLD
jgi:hypothetical protein